MAEVFQFEPRQGVEAFENVNAFVHGCKHYLDTFGKNLSFAVYQWNVSDYIHKRGKAGRVTFTFSNFDTGRSRTKWKPMAEPFVSFAMAKVRYDFGRNPNEQHSQKMAAFRVLEKALVTCSVDNVPRVENVDPHVLNVAANFLTASNPGSAYQSGCHLESLARWLVANQMTRTSFQWKNIIKKPEDLLSKISEEADAYRVKNIPSMAAIRAIPQIFHNAFDPRDILISSLTAVMFSSPDRFNEVFALSANCEHVDYRPDGSEIYGLRWYSSKKAKPEIRKIIRTMEGICRDAISRIRQVTEEARNMALWYELNPGKLYLPKEFNHLRGKELVLASELAPLLGQANGSKLCRWAGEMGLSAVKVRPPGGVGAPANAYRMADIERVVCGMLPEGFPVMDPTTGMKFGEALMVVPRNFFHEKRSSWLCMFDVVDIDTFNNQLGSGAKHGKGSIFSRNNFTEDDGSPIEVDSHDFRHYLNFLAKKKGVDQLVLALWSIRRRVADNWRYGNPITVDMVRMIRDGGDVVAESMGLVGIDVNDPECALAFESERAILELQYQYIHDTRYGYCIHPYDRSPCERRMQCLECTDHICIKGLKDKTERIKEEAEKAEKSYQLITNAISLGVHAKGSKLHKYLKLRLTVLRELVQKLDDPKIPAGTRIQLTDGDANTQLDVAVSNRISLAGQDAELLVASATVVTQAAYPECQERLLP